MNNFQKIIKLFAITLSIVIIVNIFSFALYGISLITNLNINPTINNSTSTTFKETYQDIQKIEIDAVSSNIKIKTGTRFRVETQNLKKNFTSTQKRETLIIEETSSLFNRNEDALIIIEIPESTKLKELSIDTGAGHFEIDGITVQEFEMNHGAGTLNINNSSFDEVDIDGGAGEISINSSNLNNLELDAGIGKVDIEAKITGNSKIDCGVGEINVTLLGEESNYKIITEKGLGNIKINREEQSNSTIYGTGPNKIELEEGIGNINVNFN